MNIVCVMAVHRRVPITKATIERLQRQTKPIEIVIVGDSKIERKIAEDTGVHYVEYKNYPLGAKWQAGIRYAKNLNPDAIMICGSDGWVTDNWCEVCSNYLKNYDLIGKNVWYLCNIRPNKKVEIIKRGYKETKKSLRRKTKRTSIPVGSGRIISRRILNKMNWVVFPVTKDRGLDGWSTKRILKRGGKIKILNTPKNTFEEINVLSIKGPWKTKNSYNKTKGSEKNKIYPNVKNPTNWLSKNFPKSVKQLQKVVPTAIF